MTAPVGTTRSVTLDRARHRRVVRDLALDHARMRPARWWVGAALFTLFCLGLARTTWYAAAAVAAGAAVLQVLVWWTRSARSARHGLAAGQTVTVAWGDEDLVVTDVTGEYRLPRGSVVMVRRTGGNASVHGRSLSFVLPGELLGEAEVAFLEGHGPPAEAAAPAAFLPLAVEITPTLQAHLVSAATVAVTGTADFLIGPAVAALAAVLAVATGVLGLLWVTALLVVLTVPSLIAVARLRTRFGQVCAVGRVLRGAVTPEQLVLERAHATTVKRWSAYEAVHATDDVLVLRRRRARFGRAAFDVLPLALFEPDELRVLTAAVPGRF